MAELRVQARLTGRTIDVDDFLIAVIAKAHDLAVTTRNVVHFDGLDVEVVQQKKPFVFFCYTPDHMFSLHELVVLEEPAHDPAK